MRAVVAMVVVSLGVSFGVGACGGGGGASAPPAAPAAPGANVDPNATGLVGGSINKAKAVGEKSEARDAQLEQQGGGGTNP